MTEPKWFGISWDNVHPTVYRIVVETHDAPLDVTKQYAFDRPRETRRGVEAVNVHCPECRAAAERPHFAPADALVLATCEACGTKYMARFWRKQA